MDRPHLMLCPACGQPIPPDSLAVPIVRIDDKGMPETEELDFAHHRCPTTIRPGDGTTWTFGEPTLWRLP